MFLICISSKRSSKALGRWDSCRDAGLISEAELIRCRNFRPRVVAVILVGFPDAPGMVYLPNFTYIYHKN